MNILGLDLSLKATGVCILSGNQQDMKMDTMLLERESSKGVEASILRLLSISSEIIQIINSNKITSIIIEAPAMNQKWQAAAIGELHGVVKADIYRQTSILPMVEQSTKMRKAVVGEIHSQRKRVKGKDGKIKNQVDYGTVLGKRAGKLKKATVKDIIEKRLRERGLIFPSQDEMDAYVAAKYAWDILSVN